MKSLVILMVLVIVAGITVTLRAADGPKKKFKTDLKLGSTVGELTEEYIEALGKSSVATFETFDKSFLKPGGDELRKKFLAMLKATGKSAPTMHTSYGLYESDISCIDEYWRKAALAFQINMLDLAKAQGAEMVVLHGSAGPMTDAERPLRIQQLRRSLMEITPELKRRNMRLAVEFLPRYNLGNTPGEMLEIIAGMDDVIGVCLDVNHLTGTPENGAHYTKLANIVRTFGKKIYTLHIADYDGVNEKHWLPAHPGGVIDWQEFLDALDEVGYKGVFNYETARRVRNGADHIKLLEENWNTYFAPRTESGK